MTLGFNVQNQAITRFDGGYVVADSRNFLRARFVFSTPEWRGKTKTAFFKHGAETFKALLETDDTCTVPWEVIKAPGFGVSVIAGDLITANVVQVAVTASGYAAGEASVPPTPDVYAQIMARLDKLERPPPGLMASKLLTPDDYSINSKLLTRTIESESVDWTFHFNDVLYFNGWWDFDNHPVQVATFHHTNWSTSPLREIAIPTDKSKIDDISVQITCQNWGWIECHTELTGITEFTTVEGFKSHKISGTITVPAQSTMFEFALCLGFRLSAYDQNRGYVLPQEGGQLVSSVWFKRVHGGGNVFFRNMGISGGSATNTLPAGLGYRIEFSEPLRQRDRINAHIKFPVTIGSPELPDGKIVLPYQTNLLFVPAGYENVHRSAVNRPDIHCCLHSVSTNIEIDENGITALLMDRNMYEQLWHNAESSCAGEVDYLEIITRTGGENRCTNFGTGSKNPTTPAPSPSTV